MTNEEKLHLITMNLEETLTVDELKQLIESGKPLKHYIGYEVSGKVHLGAVSAMLKIRDLQMAGVETNVFIADWHTWLNKKLDGTLETAKRMAVEYFQEALKAAGLVAGADPEKINFILGSDLYHNNPDYWAEVMRVAKATTVSRMMRTTAIMGRREEEVTDTAMLIYPAMQAADIFVLGVNIAHAGMDQRKVHVVARDAAEELGREKPITIHFSLLQGLLKPDIWPLPTDNREGAITAMKMSKSKPDSAVFIHDTPEEIRRKLNNAFAPEGETGFNPVLDWTKHLIFYDPDTTLTVKRPEKFGGDVTYSSYTDLENDYKKRELHPQDLKTAVADWLIEKLEPARKYFEDPKRKAALEEIEKLTAK